MFMQMTHAEMMYKLDTALGSLCNVYTVQYYFKCTSDRSYAGATSKV